MKLPSEMQRRIQNANRDPKIDHIQRHLTRIENYEVSQRERIHPDMLFDQYDTIHTER